MTLNRNPNNRVCDVDSYKKLPLFKNFNWKDLIDMKVRSPYKPGLLNLKDKIEEFSYLFEEVINVYAIKIRLRKELMKILIKDLMIMSIINGWRIFKKCLMCIKYILIYKILRYIVNIKIIFI